MTPPEDDPKNSDEFHALVLSEVPLVMPNGELPVIREGTIGGIPAYEADPPKLKPAKLVKKRGVLNGLIPFALAGWFSACGTVAQPVSPSPTPEHVSEVDYDINIPSVSTAMALKFSYPNGVHLSPLDAQRQWDYTAAYGGSPNVYYGETAPACEYQGVGIVVAPHSVAGLATFHAADWPGLGWLPNVLYVWVGRFVYVPLPIVGTYAIDTSAHKC